MEMKDDAKVKKQAMGYSLWQALLANNFVKGASRIQYTVPDTPWHCPLYFARQWEYMLLS